MNDDAGFLITDGACIAGKPRSYGSVLKKFLSFRRKRDVILYQYKTKPRSRHLAVSRLFSFDAKAHSPALAKE
jgi:hypothetical protein